MWKPKHCYKTYFSVLFLLFNRLQFIHGARLRSPTTSRRRTCSPTPAILLRMRICFLLLVLLVYSAILFGRPVEFGAIFPCGRLWFFPAINLGQIANAGCLALGAQFGIDARFGRWWLLIGRPTTGWGGRFVWWFAGWFIGWFAGWLAWGGSASLDFSEKKKTRKGYVLTEILAHIFCEWFTTAIPELMILIIKIFCGKSL